MDIDDSIRYTIFSRLNELEKDSQVGAEIKRLREAEARLASVTRLLMHPDKLQALRDTVRFLTSGTGSDRK